MGRRSSENHNPVATIPHSGPEGQPDEDCCGEHGRDQCGDYGDQVEEHGQVGGAITCILIQE